ncbi:MAG: hypothetical protein ACQEVA_23075, partial [Myxococcota bacterium]
MGESREETVSEWISNIGQERLRGSVRLTWQVSNFHHTPGGPTRAPMIGTVETGMGYATFFLAIPAFALFMNALFPR